MAWRAGNIQPGTQSVIARREDYQNGSISTLTPYKISSLGVISTKPFSTHAVPAIKTSNVLALVDNDIANTTTPAAMMIVMNRPTNWPKLFSIAIGTSSVNVVTHAINPRLTR